MVPTHKAFSSLSYFNWPLQWRTEILILHWTPPPKSLNSAFGFIDFKIIPLHSSRGNHHGTASKQFLPLRFIVTFSLSSLYLQTTQGMYLFCLLRQPSGCTICTPGPAVTELMFQQDFLAQTKECPNMVSLQLRPKTKWAYGSMKKTHTKIPAGSPQGGL